MKTATTLAALLAFAGMPAVAQTLPGDLPANAPIVVQGQVLQDPATIDIEQQLDGGSLPGVFMDAPRAANAEVRGPGGLESGVGAIGTMAPSTSSSNPVPLQTPVTPERGGLPLETSGTPR